MCTLFYLVDMGLIACVVSTLNMIETILMLYTIEIVV